MTAKITVLMAVYNGEAYLRECMDSVFGQTYKDFEFLIIDDGSTDSTPNIIMSYRDSRIRLLRNEKNLSQVASLNIGLDNALGEYVARIDADDIMLTRRLERQLDFLMKNPGIALVGSWGEAINRGGKNIAKTKLPFRNEEIIATILFGGFISIHSSFMFRKKIILDAGKYNEAFSFTEDYKLIIDLLLKRHTVKNMQEVFIKYRFHDDRISVRDSKPQIERYIIALRQFITHFADGFSEVERELLFNFLINAGAIHDEYWKKGIHKNDIKRIANMCDALLKNISAYFKMTAAENYFMRRVFYNKILNFAYQGHYISQDVSYQLYFYCLKKVFFLLDKPKLYLCVFHR